MREQQNPSTPELHEPLLFAPSELLACGLRDAHHHPLVGVRTEDGVRSWRTSPATAWEHPLVEWARTGLSGEREQAGRVVVGDGGGLARGGGGVGGMLSSDAGGGMLWVRLGVLLHAVFDL